MAGTAPRRPTEYDLWSRSKRDGVTAVADALEAIANAKRARNTVLGGMATENKATSEQEQEKDMLSDLLQLQFHYMSRLASIRNDYGAIGKRLLERAYTAVAGRPDAACAELEFTAADPGEKYFLVENRISPQAVDATLELTPFEGPRPLAPVKGAIELTDAPGTPLSPAPGGLFKLSVPGGAPTFVRVKVDPSDLRKGLRYRATITVKMGSSVRRVVVHARFGAP